MESEASSTTSARPGADGRRTTRTPGWVIIVYLIAAGLLLAATALASSAIALMGSVRHSAGTDADTALILGFMAKATVVVVLVFFSLAMGAVAAICHAVGRHGRAADDRHQQIPAMLADAYAAGYEKGRAEAGGTGLDELAALLRDIGRALAGHDESLEEVSRRLAAVQQDVEDANGRCDVLEAKAVFPSPDDVVRLPSGRTVAKLPPGHNGTKI